MQLEGRRLAILEMIHEIADLACRYPLHIAHVRDAGRSGEFFDRVDFGPIADDRDLRKRTGTFNHREPGLVCLRPSGNLIERNVSSFVTATADLATMRKSSPL